MILIIVLLTLYCTSYNLLEIPMKYNLLNVAVFKELPKIIKHLYTILGNYEYFNGKSIEIIVNMTVIVLNNAADIIFPNGELIGAGTYTYEKSIKDDITRNDLRDFIILVEDIRNKILDNDWYRLQEK